MEYSIVEFIGDSNSSCGYCKSDNRNHNVGMWAYALTVDDYQDLIDRGWRRSGHYCYKPCQTLTCCPLFTIRCDALDLKLSKSQKKILKRVGKYLVEGDTAKTSHPGDPDSGPGNEVEPSSCNMLDKNISHILEQKSEDVLNGLMDVDASTDSGGVLTASGESPQTPCQDENIEGPTKTVSKTISEIQQQSEDGSKQSTTKIPKPGVGRDTSKPESKKAKLLRLEKKQKKMLEKGLCVDTVTKSKQSSEKSLEDFIRESQTESAVNKLEIRLLPSNDKEPLITESWHLYRKYQMAIHNETEDDCSYRTFNSFLVASPLKPQKKLRGKGCPIKTGYGSFHHQYWLNGKLIAVGVIDVLPKCVSSVYFFYDPDYSFLSLGTYGSLREMELVRSLQKQSADISYYYMGYYIHSCPKMRYKARYSPSSLLCPEVYTWQPIAECQKKLDHTKYCRFNDDPSAICEDSLIFINEVQVLYNRSPMSYPTYVRTARGITVSDEEEVRRYAELVGRRCAKHMLLYRQP